MSVRANCLPDFRCRLSGTVFLVWTPHMLSTRGSSSEADTQIPRQVITCFIISPSNRCQCLSVYTVDLQPFLVSATLATFLDRFIQNFQRMILIMRSSAYCQCFAIHDCILEKEVLCLFLVNATPATFLCISGGFG